ncbi:MAG: sulfatase [Planctomycetota bacterium]
MHKGWMFPHVAILGSMLPAVGVADAEEPTARTRPNILFIMSDDHAAQAIGCYGSKINRTPNLDRLAAEGMRFKNCFVTNSICGPSRAVILTGKYSHLNGFFDNTSTFDGSQQTFPKLLQQAGYKTAMIGKWHLVSDPTGFDHWEILIGQGPYFNPPMKTPAGIVKHAGYTTDIITELALDYLKNRDQDKPFLLMWQHKAPHREWQSHPRHRHLFANETIPEPSNLFDDYSNRGKAAKLQEMTIARHMSPLDLKLVPPADADDEQKKEWHDTFDAENAEFLKNMPQGDDWTRWNYQRYMKEYLRAVAAVDDGVGRVLDYLKESGLDKNTIVVYTSDQGFFLGEHGWYDKRWMYEESLRSPLLVRWPGVVKPGSTADAMVLNLDFPETFLEAAGVPVPGDMQGRSLVPVLRGETPADWRKSMYYRYYEFPAVHSVRQHFGVRNERYKLIYFPDFDEWEFYDLEKDPQEMKSAYAEPEYAATIDEMKQELARLKQEYRDENQQPGPKRRPAAAGKAAKRKTAKR